MSLLRLFIAVDLPAPIRQAIQSNIAPLQKELGSAFVRWAPTEHMHLTLKFLGDVAPVNVNFLTQSLRTEAERIPVFNMRVGGIGSFPSLRRARVLFMGIQAPAELEALRRGIEEACIRLGFAAEIKAFHPHLTLGRVKQEASAAERQKITYVLERIKIDLLGAVRVDSVHLYKSDLKPTGAVYTKLYSAPLKP